jgi:hypothetical protein
LIYPSRNESGSEVDLKRKKGGIDVTPKKRVQLQRTNEQPANKKITEFFDGKKRRNNSASKRVELQESHKMLVEREI